MRLDKIDLNLFVVFDAIYREASVTKVAVRLNLTQPAVSNALSRLRQMFDDQLFVRTPQGMRPTPVADNVIADVRKALALLGRSVDSSLRFDPAVSEKVFNLGMSDLAQSWLLPALNHRLMQTAPQVRINAYYVDRTTAVDELKSGVMDLQIDAPLINAKELLHQPLASYPYRLAMRRGHPLARRKMTLEMYLSAQHLHVSSRRKGRGHVDVALHAMGQQRDISIRVENYLVGAKIAERTDLLWAVPELLARDLPLKVLDIPFETPSLDWDLYWSKSADADPANQWMREQIGLCFEAR